MLNLISIQRKNVIENGTMFFRKFKNTVIDINHQNMRQGYLRND
jgi:hypothetical protein